MFLFLCFLNPIMLYYNIRMFQNLYYYNIKLISAQKNTMTLRCFSFQMLNVVFIHSSWLKCNNKG